MEYFTDPRDGRKYRTVKIGGVLWMAENLNYKIGNSWCYNDDESYGSRYGRLYTWDAAKAACPPGWMLPGKVTLDCLIRWDLKFEMAFGAGAGKVLKATRGWSDNGNGIDSCGFSALPGGRRFPPSMYINATYEGVWWMSDEYENDSTYAYAFGTECDRDDMYINHGDVKANGFSVRCIKNYKQ